MNAETPATTWATVFRLDDSEDWHDWSSGHRTVPEVLAVAELMAKIPAIAEIRFDRITTVRERFSLADLGTDAPAPAAVSSSAPADRTELRDRIRALALLEAADFLRDAHFRDGLSVQEIGTALRHTADTADPMVGSLARDGFGLDEIAAMPDTAAPPAPVDRATVLHQTERDMLAYALDLAQDQMHSRSGEFTAEDQEAVDALRRLAGEARDERETQATTVADEVVAAMHIPCSFPPCDTGPGEPCDTHERLWAHAEGDHELCGPECSAAPAQQPEAAEGAQQ